MRVSLARMEPLAGAVLFGAIFFLARLGSDWLFRWVIPDQPMPPLWSVLLTQTIGTAIFSGTVYSLLLALRRQEQAVRDLNHELRNALQVFTYIIGQSASADVERGRAAVLRMTSTLARVSKDLGIEGRERRKRKRA